MSILGEAVNQVSRLDPELAEGLTRYREVVGLRNVLAPQYGEIDQRIIWNIVERHVPVLRDEVRAMLDRA